MEVDNEVNAIRSDRARSQRAQYCAIQLLFYLKTFYDFLNYPARV